MNEDGRNLLVRAYKKEKNPVTKDRIHAVCMIKINGLTVTETAALYCCDRHTVAEWISCYEKGGLAGLADRPRSGRPPKAAAKKISKILAKTDMITEPRDLREAIRKKHRTTSAPSAGSCVPTASRPRFQKRCMSTGPTSTRYAGGNTTPKGAFYA